MPTAVAVQHVAFEDLGLLDPLLRRRGFDVHLLDAATDDLAGLADADLVVVLGGPLGVADEERYPLLSRERTGLGVRLRQGAPTIGICLGAQLLAAELGAAVTRLPVKEIGFAPIALTAAGQASPLGLLGDQPVLHWHGDGFQTPAPAIELAGTPAWPHQAFAVGGQVLGLQFHLEVDPQLIERWLVGHAVELALAGTDPRTLRADAARHAAGLRQRGTAVLDAWLDHAGW